MTDEIGFPIIAEDAGAAAAMQAMRAHRIGGVAVSQPGQFVLVRADDIMDSEPQDKSLSAIADAIPIGGGVGRTFIEGPDEGRRNGGLLYLKVKNINVDLFKVPAAYKQCTKNHNHVFGPDYNGSKCPLSDGGDLVLVF